MIAKLVSIVPFSLLFMNVSGTIGKPNYQGSGRKLITSGLKPALLEVLGVGIPIAFFCVALTGSHLVVRTDDTTGSKLSSVVILMLDHGVWFAGCTTIPVAVQ